MKYERIPYLVVFDETAAFKDTYAGQIGKVTLEAHLLKPETPSDTVVVMMHPIGGGAYLPMPGALAKLGVHVIYGNSRFRGNDTALTMEKVALDLGAVVRDAKERLGYRKVILGGWSGGGGLSLFYQAQATDPTVTHTPAGDPLDLTAAGLIPADGVMLLAAHLSRNLTMTEWLDPSISDESRPFDRDVEWNLYDPKNPNRAPYSADYQAEFARRQIARNDRISDWCFEQLDALKKAGKPNHERCFTVQGTMAAPLWLDPAIDANGRKPNWCFLGDPEVVNDGPVGLGRFTTLRSWLSQWSYRHSNADGLKAAAKLTVPLLVIENGADDACTPSHAARLLEAAATRDRTHYMIEGANHYYFGQPELCVQASTHVATWLKRFD